MSECGGCDTQTPSLGVGACGVVGVRTFVVSVGVVNAVVAPLGGSCDPTMGHVGPTCPMGPMDAMGPT